MFLIAHGETAFVPETLLLWELHPASVHFPIAFLLGGVAFDAYAWWRGRTDLARQATWLMAAGALLGAVAVATGAVAFFTVPAHSAVSHDLMLWHLGVMAGAMVVFSAVTTARSRMGWPGLGVRLAGIFGAALLLIGAYLGGNLVYRQGTGVDPRLLTPEVRGEHHHENGPTHSEHP